MKNMSISEVTPFPEQIRLENTNACNAHCVICPRELQTRKIGFMESVMLDRILSEAKGRRITKFTIQGYGEPLLDKHFCEYMQRAKNELGCPTFTVSNGSIITPELAWELVACGLDKIKISFYGTNKKEYEEIHKPLKYEETYRSIMNLVEAKRKACSKMVIRLQYIGKLWKFIPFSIRWLGKVMVGYNTLHNYGNGRSYRTPEEKAKDCPILSASILQVLWNGDVVPCCYDFDGKMVLGNLYEENIERIWHGERYTELRRAHVSRDFSDWPICRICDKRFR